MTKLKEQKKTDKQTNNGQHNATQKTKD